LLRKATWENLSSSLAAYEAVRLPIANDVLIESYHSGRMYEFDSEYGDDYPRLGPAIKKQWDWIDNISLEEEVQAAFALVERDNVERHDMGGNIKPIFSRL
jgi:salicylate hydroxylase